jgi:NAD(P)H-hydrate epimerase
MAKADAATIAGGIPGLDLMEAAGTAIVREIRRRWRPRPVVVLCGPGNNGGDGYVVARLLEDQGWPVRVGALVAREALTGDAAVNCRRWRGRVDAVSPVLLSGDPLIVDALFGAGLARALSGPAAAIVQEINERKLDCVGVDVPSGVHGDSGQVLGTAPACRLTVTFFRAKPGHLLLPGRTLAGDLVIADIGIPASVLTAIAPTTFANGPELWLERYPWPRADANKYSRGHAVVAGGAVMTGAARLAALAARRIGAGLVSVAAPEAAFAIYAQSSPGTIVQAVNASDAFAAYLADPRRNAVLIGPGAGVHDQTRTLVLTALAMGKPCVLDADALTVFSGDPNALFSAIRGPCLLTPHDGEFARLFSGTGDRLTRARQAARQSGAVVLLKGPDTVIAAPDGRAAIEARAPADLATAGSGDVLAGLALGLLAQGLSAFDAGCAATWIHGQAAALVGCGLIAEDLITAVPTILKRLRAGL